MTEEKFSAYAQPETLVSTAWGQSFPGVYALTSRHLAYGERKDPISVEEGQEMQVELEMSTRPIELDPILVSVRTEGEMEAMAVGGRLISRQDIEQVRARSTDMGDLGHIMPVTHPYIYGASGVAHANDYLMVHHVAFEQVFYKEARWRSTKTLEGFVDRARAHPFDARVIGRHHTRNNQVWVGLP